MHFCGSYNCTVQHGALTLMHASLHSTNPLVPPMTAAPPTELSTTNIPVCCAGVQLNLAKPDDLSIQVRVLVDSTPHPPNQVTRDGSFLYIMGLQAGTEYSLNITLTNILGTVWLNTTVRPLLGELVWANCNAHLLVPPPSSPPHRPPLHPTSGPHPHCWWTDCPTDCHVPRYQGGHPPVLHLNVSITSQQTSDRTAAPPCYRPDHSHQW